MTTSMFKGLEDLSCEERLREVGMFTLEKKEPGENSSMCINAWKECGKQRNPGSFSLVFSDRTRGNGKTERGVLAEDKETLVYCEGNWALSQIAQRDHGVFILEGTQKPSGQDPGQSALGDPAWAEEFYQMSPSDSFQNQSLYLE